MSQYALIGTDDVILEYRSFSAKPNDPVGKGWRWLPVIVTDPAFDSETQVREGSVVTVTASEVTKVFSVRDKTAKELDADKTREVDGISVAIIRALCNHENRIRALNAQEAVTFAQCKAAIKALIP
ncbi:MAG: hypothetical protein ACREJC_17460 [Tepidisphaeraceae bacterium]